MKKIGRQKGMSLMSVLVAIGLTGILAMTLSRIMTNNMRVMNKIKRDSQKERVKNLFLQKFPCFLSSCKKMREKINKSNFNQWHFQSTCHPQKGLLVQTRRQDPKSKKVLLHPLKRTPEKWQNLFDLNEGYLCGISSSPFEQESLNDISQEHDMNSPSQEERRKKIPLEINSQELQKKINEKMKSFCPEGQQAKGMNFETLEIICE